jgi:predicted Zn-dependent protease
MKRRAALSLLALSFAAACPLGASAQAERVVPSSVVDAVALYVIPTDGIDEQGAANVARALTRHTGLWVKSSLWVPSGVNEPFAGTNQYPAEDYLPLGISLSKQLPDAGPRSYFIVLTDRDINSRSQNFRAQFSFHKPMARTSVLSMARLQHEMDGTPSRAGVVAERVQKMLLRIVGEMKLGWQRSNEPTDLMYAPITSTEDIDRLNLERSMQGREAVRP